MAEKFQVGDRVHLLGKHRRGIVKYTAATQFGLNVYVMFDGEDFERCFYADSLVQVPPTKKAVARVR